MVKDVTNSTLTEIKVDFQPAVINIDREAIEAQVAAAVAQYSGREVTAENYKSVYDERTRFNNLIKELDNQRKDLNRMANEPVKDTEIWLKEKVIKPIEDVTKIMTVGINAVDEHKRMLRLDVVRTTFEDKCMAYGLDKDSFENKYDDYAKAGQFKSGKFELKKSALDEMDALVLAEFDAAQQFRESKETISETAIEYELPANGYITHLEEGKSLVDVLKMMKSDRDAEILRKEQQEARSKAEAERKAEIDRMAKEKANANIMAIDAATGEIIENEPSEEVAVVNVPSAQEKPQEVPKFEPSEPATFDFRVTFPCGIPQAKFFKSLFEQHGVTTQTLFNGKTQDELAGGTFNVF
ncbi:TPA: DUF1351 domain-containing protein [Streptococcus suis]|nr:DUF1351 domain-containing protein [Streptococcus suis]HEL1711836.1 DUF1351 domain-containing protein [Streptococcus suis]HEL2452001.1 DUF1351 domain-containing protein [Streptococcus suis]HEL2532480.1 DUF1351 domain-containing protein [Streptococcus suis]HEL9641336.1 DUF1351 domain-containing protein [Streptococcus suis]